MAIIVRQNLVSQNKWSIKCPNIMDAKYITVHNTANDASADNEVKYMIGNDSQISYHFAIDDKEVVQSIPINRNAWHCGDGSGINSGNRTSIGIEICYSKSGGTKYINAEMLAIKFIAQLLNEKNWNINKVKKHQDWSGKYCPHRILDTNGWQSFLNKIQSELNQIKKVVDDELIDTTKILLNGKEFTVERILKNGTNFIKLRDLEKLGLKIDYDETKKMPIINS